MVDPQHSGIVLNSGRRSFLSVPATDHDHLSYRQRKQVTHIKMESPVELLSQPMQLRGDGCPGKIKPYRSPFCCGLPVQRREMEPRVKKFESPSSRSKRVERIAHLSTNRTKQNASSIKPDTRPSVSAFSFKSDERAERRKRAKAQHKSTSPASGAAARPQLLSRAGYDQALSANEPVKTTNQPEPSGRTDPPPAKNERGKVKDPNFQRHRVSENTKVPKDLKFEGKEKMGNHRSSSEILRKSIKRIGIGSNSGKGHLAVGVAS
ncbi:hypothetical protein OIU84_021297 [Salix udensis]|uniref:Uncharacterized protein n=1 Tax=Salix udensis TaxID=889485 RepID=A0AAD6KWU8_9ROSI|nr:hypothetical protein OIU84_021297 [Salix udensis]